MAHHHSTRAIPPDPSEPIANDLPLDHALSLLLADETENALRWGAAVLESGPWTPSALVVTARLLDQMGRRRAAIEGLNLAVQQATTEGNLPLALAAIGDLRTLGADVAASLDQIAGAFCAGSERLEAAQSASLLPQLGEFRPLSPFLTGPALASKAAQIVETVRRTGEDVASKAPSRIAPLPLFSALSRDALHDLLAAFETLTVPGGHAVIREGEEEAAAYIVARGELEVSRRSTDGSGKPVVVARLASGAFFGEMAILSQLPGAASVTATRPSILLAARREALEAVVERHPEVAVELAAHCRRQSVANLGWASPAVVAIPARERAALVERFETRLFEAGDRLVEAGEAALGLHLIVSGEIAVVAHEDGERVVLANLTAGETVGEVELVLCRAAAADAIAVRPTATLFLQREEFFALVQDHPAILHGLYGIAVRRRGETCLAIEAGSAAVEDESLHEAVTGNVAALVEDPVSRGVAQPAGPSRITPLGKGTLDVPRTLSTPSSPLPPSAPSSSRPAPPSPVRPPPRTTLPPPPMPAAVSGPPPSPRRTLPPPVPPAARVDVALPQVGGGSAPSVAPVTAAQAKAMASPTPSNGPQWIAGLAMAAAACIFLAIRWFHGDPTHAAASLKTSATTATTTAQSNPASGATAEGPKEAPPPIVAKPEPRPPIVAKPGPHPPAVAKPSVRVPAVAKMALTVATPDVAPVAVTASASSTPETATAPALSAPPIPSFPAQKPAVAGPALTVGEFGGRE
jgi:cAMP-dependent protein kinase regulator